MLATSASIRSQHTECPGRIKTLKEDVDLIHARLKAARLDFGTCFGAFASRSPKDNGLALLLSR